jgi:hypothetical protein
VLHDEAGVVVVFDGPGRRKAAEQCYSHPMTSTFLDCCPNTGQTVQGWSANEDAYQLFACLACTRVHLVNLKTGKVLGEEEEAAPSFPGHLYRVEFPA